MTLLAEIISSGVRAEIFRLLFGMQDEALHMREIERRSGYAIGTIQTELKKLVRLDLVTQRRDGNRVYYAANKEHPLYAEIHGLVLKTVGLVDTVHEALAGEHGIGVAFVFGSVARHEEKAGSDVDLMVVGTIGLRALTSLLSGVSERIGREINPHVMTPKEFTKRREEKDHFVTRILEDLKLFVIGTEHDLETVGR